jgi:hypothetical protein
MTRSLDEHLPTAELFNILEEVLGALHGTFSRCKNSPVRELWRGSQPLKRHNVSWVAVRHWPPRWLTSACYWEDIQACLLREDQHADWGDIWRRGEAVDPLFWARVKFDLELTCRKVMIASGQVENWDDPEVLGGALAFHTAYCPSETRQALCTLMA